MAAENSSSLLPLIYFCVSVFFKQVEAEASCSDFYFKMEKPYSSIKNKSAHTVTRHNISIQLLKQEPLFTANSSFCFVFVFLLVQLVLGHPVT